MGHRAAVAVDDPWDPDADVRRQGAVERDGKQVEHAGGGVEDPVRSWPGVLPGLGDDGTVGVDDRAQDLGRPDVQADP